MDLVAATNEFVGILRVGSCALQHALEGDDGVWNEVETELSQIALLIDRLDQIAKRLRDRASEPPARFA